MPRIALRDAARNRAAAAPAIAAVMAAVAGSVAIGLYLDSSHAQNVASYQAALPTGNGIVYIGVSNEPGTTKATDVAATLAAISETLPDSHTYQFSRVACADSTNPNHYCSLMLQNVPERACPYLDILGSRQLTGDETRSARKDIRCKNAFQQAGYSYGDAVVDDAATLAALSGASGDDLTRAVAVLRSGGVIVPAQYVTDGRATFSVMMAYKENNPTFDPSAHPIQISFPAYALTSGIRWINAVISPGALAAAKLGSTRDQAVVATTRMPTQAEQDRLTKQLHALHSDVYIEHGPASDTNPMLWILAAAAAAVALGATAIATGLAASDGRADLSTLAAVGASPTLRRGLSLSQSGIISGLGSILGATAGLGVAAAVLTALNQRFADMWPGPEPFPITVPWASLGVALLIVPLIAMAGAGLLTRSRLPIERRR